MTISPWLGPLTLAGLTGAIYAPALFNGFVWDDFPVLVLNPAVHGLSDVGSFFTDYRTGVAQESMAYYRPLRTLVHAVLYQVTGLSAAAFHAVNVVLHVVNVLLVWVLCRAWAGRWAVAWVVAAIFALHPIHTEAVTNVTGLTDVLFTCFVLLALLAHHSWTQGKTTGAVSVPLVYGAFLLALASKEMALTLPFLVILVTWLSGWSRAGDRRGPSHAIYLVGLFGLALLWIVLRSHLLGGAAAGEWAGVTFRRTMLMQATVLEKYLRLLVFPFGQSIRHVVPIPEPELAPSVLRALAIVGVVGAIGVYHVRRNRHVAFGIAWFFVALLPVMNLVPLRGAMMGERFLYLPMLGLAYAAAHLARPVFLSLRARGGVRTGAMVVGMGLAVLGTLTVRRNLEWKDNVTIFESGVRVSPESNALRLLLMNEYERLGRMEDRAAHARAGAANTVRYRDQYLRLGEKAEAAGRSTEAVAWYRRALGLDPGNDLIRNRLERLRQSPAASR